MNRLSSLDAFRGITIAGMILVNNPGSWKHVYPPLRHAEWHGWTPTDLIFPFFLFIVGVSISLALSKRVSQEAGLKNVYTKIFKRSVILFALGLFLALLPNFNFSQVRIPGVLQRIAVCYLVSSIVFLKTGVRGRAIAVISLLGGYWALMKLVPVPGYGAGVLSPEGNLCGYIDSKIFGSHLYKPGFDPEGILSTLPAAATTLLGVLTGDWLRSKARANRNCIGLLFSGVVFMFFGLWLHRLFPINKQLWTSTFVVLTAGAALILFGILYAVIDVLGLKKWSIPLLVFGTNAIALYVGSGLLIKSMSLITVMDAGNLVQLKTYIFQNLLSPWAGPLNGSLIYPLLLLFLGWAIMFPLYKKEIFIKI
jgi:predicted acyltransferase